MEMMGEGKISETSYFNNNKKVSSHFSPFGSYECPPYCEKIVRIRSFSGPYFSVFELNTKIYSVNLISLTEWGKLRTKKTLNMDTFQAIPYVSFFLFCNIAFLYIDVHEITLQFNCSTNIFPPTIVNFI